MTRLNEISRPSSRTSVDEILHSNGWERLGNGVFAGVYGKDTKNYVLKVFSSVDTAYYDYIKLIKNNQDNPHFPKIIGKLVKVTPKYYAVRMEKLSPYKHDPSLISTYLKTRDTELTPNSYMDMQREDAYEFLHDKPNLKLALDLVLNNLAKYETDIKKDNLMLRGKTIVITDPVTIGTKGSIEQEVLPFRQPKEKSSNIDWNDPVFDELFGHLK